MNKFSFGDSCPVGFQPIPIGSVSDLCWVNSLGLSSVDAFYVEHQLSQHSILNIRDFLVSCFNVLAGADSTLGGFDAPHTRIYDGLNSIFIGYHMGPSLAYSLNKKNSTYKIIERFNILLNQGTFGGQSPIIIFSFGEINCRSHILKQAHKQSKPVELIVDDVVAAYGDFLIGAISKGIRPMVWGAIASTSNSLYDDPNAPAYGTVFERNSVVEIYNKKLRALCESIGVVFLCIFEDLINSDLSTKREYYCDDIHASQAARIFLWREIQKYLPNYLN